MRNNRRFARRNFLAADEYSQDHGTDCVDPAYRTYASAALCIKSKHKYKKFAIAQMTVNSRSRVLAVRLNPYARSHSKSAPMRMKAKLWR